MLTVLTFTVTASCYACGFNILANTAFSREGSGFAVIRSLPVPLTDYYKSKRNFAMMIWAREASKAFGKAATAARKLEQCKNLPVSALYGKREEIMRLRMEGMLKAAEVKAQSAKHEQYLKSKAKLSCLSILMDQLEEMQKEAKSQMEDAEERKLSAKHRSLSKELEAVRAEVERTLPPIEQT